MAIMNNPPQYVNLSPVQVTSGIHEIQDTLSVHRGLILLCNTHIAALRDAVKTLDERSCENAIEIIRTDLDQIGITVAGLSPRGNRTRLSDVVRQTARYYTHDRAVIFVLIIAIVYLFWKLLHTNNSVCNV
jgi:hypothetical protein